jgi:hypothetical protein
MKLDLDLEKTVTLTTLELLALKFPAKKMRKVTKEPYKPIDDEVIKDVPGTNGASQVTSLGRFINHFTTVKGEKISYLKRPFTQGQHSKIFIDYTVNGRTLKEQLPRLLCRVFYPIPDSETKCVIHSDGNIHNVSVDNLRWGTKLEASLHHKKLFPEKFVRNLKRKFKTKSGKIVYLHARYTTYQMTTAKRMIEAGVSIVKIAELLNMRIGAVQSAKKFKTVENNEQRIHPKGNL